MRKFLIRFVAATFFLGSASFANTQCETHGGQIYQVRVARSLERVCGFAQVLYVGLNSYELYQQNVSTQAVSAFLNKKTGCGGLQNISPVCASAGGHIESDERNNQYCIFNDGSFIDGLTLCMGSKDLNKFPGGSPF